MDDAAGSANDLHAIVVALVIRGGNILEQCEVAVPIDGQAAGSIVANVQSFRHEAGAGVGDMDAVPTAGQRQEADLHEIGIVEVEQILVYVVRDGGDKLGHTTRISGTAHEEASIQAQAHVRFRGHHRGINERIHARIDVHHGAAGQLVDAQHVDWVRLGCGGQLAGEPIVAERGRAVFVVHVALVVDPVSITALGHSKFLRAAVHHQFVVQEGNLDAKAISSKIDAVG